MARQNQTLASLSAILAGLVVRNLLEAAWERGTGDEAPTDPTAPDVLWREALTWAAVSGVTIGVARVVAKRMAGKAYTKATA